MSLANIAALILGIFLVIMTILFIFRIVLTWYPTADVNRFPLNLVVLPTEPFLSPSRKIIPPLGGVDITPIIWVGILTLLREMLLSPEGLISMLLN